MTPLNTPGHDCRGNFAAKPKKEIKLQISLMGSLRKNKTVSCLQPPTPPVQSPERDEKCLLRRHSPKRASSPPGLCEPKTRPAACGSAHNVVACRPRGRSHAIPTTYPTPFIATKSRERAPDLPSLCLFQRSRQSILSHEPTPPPRAAAISHRQTRPTLLLNGVRGHATSTGTEQEDTNLR